MKVSTTLAALPFIWPFFPHRVYAQGEVISATAAWSSQIVAFWGAVGLGARICVGQRITNPFTAIVGLLKSIRRASDITSALERNAWVFLSPGLQGGSVRIHVVVIPWRTRSELKRFALRVALLAEAVAFHQWSIVVVGRKIIGSTTIPELAFWTICPRAPEYSTVRNKLSGDLIPQIEDDQILALSRQIHFGYDAIAQAIVGSGHPPTRVAIRAEVAVALQNATTMARYITSWQIPDETTPFVQLNRAVGQYDSSCSLIVTSAVLMYTLVHLAVSVAVGLMAAATGRGLAVWIFSSRVVIAQLCGSAFVGDECFFTLLAFGNSALDMETDERAFLAAGDVSLQTMQFRFVLLAFALNLIEIIVIVGGWAYGALRAQRFAPTGLVGHGMVWLALTGSILLAIRALMGVKDRLSSRIIGIFQSESREYAFQQLVVHQDCVLEIPTVTTNDASHTALRDKYTILHLISGILSHASEDGIALFSALCLLRTSSFAAKVEEFAVAECMSYVYDGDRLATIHPARKGPERQNLNSRTRRIIQNIEKKMELIAEVAPTGRWQYPWETFTICIIVIMLSTGASATYTYVSQTPTWVKLVIELVVSICAVTVATLERMSPLSHLQAPYMSFMIAATVVCSVWYVGVDSVGIS